MTLLVLISALLLASTSAAFSSTNAVRVAAIQCPSPMGSTAANVSNLTALIRQAAAQGARVIVTPECAVQGYCDPVSGEVWTRSPDAGGYAVATAAESIPGPSSLHFARLADELEVYLCIGLIESASNRFYNAQVLLAPDGTLAAHHRKRALWTPGDGGWCTPGDRPPQVVQTPFGRLGLMICYDYNVMPIRLKAAGADIVLYSVGWYGPNEKFWFTEWFPRDYVKPHGFAVIAANWSAPLKAESWPGAGHSCILAADGSLLRMARTVHGNEIVLAEIPLPSVSPPVSQ